MTLLKIEVPLQGQGQGQEQGQPQTQPQPQPQTQPQSQPPVNPGSATKLPNELQSAWLSLLGSVGLLGGEGNG